MGSLAFSGTLTTRQERILFALCRAYILSGRPVSSSALSRAHGLRWSSATIRNELKALERAGFVRQLHHSAGRTPTPAGIRAYVSTLGRLQAPSPEVRRAVDLAFTESLHGPESLRPAAHVLSDLGRCVAVAVVARDHGGVISELKLAPLSGASALVMMTLDDGTATMQRVQLDSDLSAGADHVALERLEERLRGLCLGKTLQRARDELQQLLDLEEARLDRVLAEALRVGLWMCVVASLDPLWVQVAGRGLLANRPGGHDDGFVEILGLLEDYHRLAEVLRQLLPDPGEEDGYPRAEVHVDAKVVLPHAVGTLTGHRVLSGLSLVGCRIPAAGRARGIGRSGAIALLGPDRMDYERVIPLVEYAARALATRTGE